MATMIFTTHACCAARISITSTGKHIQNAKFATFPDFVRASLSRLTFLLMYIILFYYTSSRFAWYRAHGITYYYRSHDEISMFLENSEKVGRQYSINIPDDRKNLRGKKSSRVTCRMAYLRAQATRYMLSYSIAMPAAISTAIINMASLISTTRKFTENIGNVVTASAQQQSQQQRATSGGVGIGTNDIIR
jgi:hypothetical protein